MKESSYYYALKMLVKHEHDHFLCINVFCDTYMYFFMSLSAFRTGDAT